MFVIVGPGGNTTVQIGPEGPLVVDTQPAALSGAVLDAIRSLTAQPIRHIVLTSGDDQAAGGAGTLSKAGRYVRVIDSIDPRGSDTRASIIAHLNVLNRMNATKAPTDIWPTDTYFTAQWSLFSNGEAVRFVHVPAGAHRRRHDGVLPPLRRDQHRRDLRHDGVSRGSIPIAAAASTACSTRSTASSRLPCQAKTRRAAR